MAEVRRDQPYEPSTEHPYMPQRLAEDVIPYRGPAHLTVELRMRRAVIGFVLFLVVAIAAVLIVWLQGPIR